MAGYSKLFSDSMLAYGDLSAYQYHWMKISSSRTVNLCGNTEQPYGILQNDPAAAGRPAEVMVYGISNLVAGGSITAGNLVGSDTNGHGVAVSTDDLYFGGIAREDAATSDIFSILLTPGGVISGSGDD